MRHAVVEVVAWLIAGAWVHRLVVVWFGLKKLPNLLNQGYAAAPTDGESVAVIVPARNEEKRVEECLRSLANQDYRDLVVVAVNDRSDDATGRIMEGVASESGRVEVLEIEMLPDGWLGKTHAMATGAQYAVERHRPDWLLFTDADIVFRCDAIRRSMAAACQSGADHFVTLPTTIAESRGEAMLLSFMQVLSLWAVQTWRVADPKSKRDAIGVGAFNMIRTEAYREVGGFESIRMEILEDLTLGRRVKRAGLRQRVALGPGLVSVHWAPGLGGIVRGITKNLFAVFDFRIWLLLASAVWLATFCLLPVVLFAMPWTRAAGAVWVVGVGGLYLLSSRWTGFSPGYSLLLPVGAAVLIYAMLRSLAVTMWTGGVTWRGTFYSLQELRRHRRSAREPAEVQ